MTSFAKAQLMKYGWTEGKGLGKNEDGISEPLKPKMKFDNTGIGHSDKEVKWWETAYNEASKNVKIHVNENTQKISAKDPDSFEIKPSGTSFRKLKKTGGLKYGSFMKTCTLDNGKMVEDDNADNQRLLLEAEDKKPVMNFALTDEELFAACGGRTAHKGARHGLNLSGKLARIAQQEAELLGNVENPDWTLVKKKKKSKRKKSPSQPDEPAPMAIEESKMPAEVPEVREKSKCARKKERRRVAALASQLDAFSLIEIEDDTDSPKRKRKTDKKATDVKRDCKRIKKSHSETDESQKGSKESQDEDCIVVDFVKHHKCSKKRLSTDAEAMNAKIAKKKLKGSARSEKRKLERLTECLTAVTLCEDSVDSGRGEDLPENASEGMRKLKKSKKHKKEKKKRAIEVITIGTPTSL